MGRDFSYMTKNAVDTEIVDRHAPTEFCRWIVSNFTMCYVFTDDGIHWHIIPLGSVPQFNGLVVSAGKDV